MMGLIVVFLSLTNIALGYGLAVYLRRASSSVSLLRTTAPQPETLPTAPPMAPPVPVSPLAVAATPVASPATQDVSSEKPPIAEDSVVEPVAATEVAQIVSEVEDTKPVVNEENVLAGIEAFRAQLAQVKEVESEAIKEPATAMK